MRTIYNLGELTGYGPNPVDCIDLSATSILLNVRTVGGATYQSSRLGGCEFDEHPPTTRGDPTTSKSSRRL